MCSIRELDFNSQNPATSPSRPCDQKRSWSWSRVSTFLLVLAVGLWVAWYFGALQGVVSAFDDWMRYIRSGDRPPMNQKATSQAVTGISRSEVNG